MLVERERRASVSRDEVDESDRVERGRLLALESDLELRLVIEEGSAILGVAIAWISDAASSNWFGLSILAADSEARLFLLAVGTPPARAALAASFSAICSATVRPPSADSTKEARGNQVSPANGSR